MPLEIQSSLRGQQKPGREGDSERLYSVYSREQEIKVQEGGDQEGRAVSWLCVTWRFPEGDRTRSSSPIQTHFMSRTGALTTGTNTARPFD